MKTIKRFLPLFLFVFILLGLKGTEAKASDSTSNVSVVVPTNVDLVFEEDQKVTSSPICISNGSTSAITVQKVVVTEYNDWKLVSEEKEILVDTKELSFALDGTQLFAGENQVKFRIESNTEHAFEVKVKRGAWSKSIASEVAFSLEFQYEVEKREFTLCLMEDDSGTQKKYQVKEGDVFQLPTPKLLDYVFKGWEDTSYKRHTGSFVMPSKNVPLKALWEMPAYAIYTAGNQTLTFLQTDVPYSVGATFNGATITKLYSDFSSKTYGSKSEVPWVSDGNNKKITKVVFKSAVHPISTAYWFYDFENCLNFDVTNLKTYDVKDMSYMFYRAGYNSSGKKFIITGMNYWNTSKVVYMKGMFRYSGPQASSYQIGDITGWDVSSVTTMEEMFYQAGYKAIWSINLSGWNVKKGVSYTNFNKDVESKVISPKWQ